MIPDHSSSAQDSNCQSPDKSSKELSSSNLDIQGVSQPSENAKPDASSIKDEPNLLNESEVAHDAELHEIIEEVMAESPTPSEQAQESSVQLPEHMTVKRFGTPPPKVDHKLDRDVYKSALSSNC